MHLTPSRSGIQLRHGRHLISEVLREAGPTHSIFDVMAVAVAALSVGSRIAMLGFAGGGLVAPLRALGRQDGIEAVDLDLTGARLFRALSKSWCGSVRIEKQDAEAFLIQRRTRFPCIIEDLSAQVAGGDIQNPEVCFTSLPALEARRLTTQGLLVANVLPNSLRSRTRACQQKLNGFASGCWVRMSEYENRILLASRALPDAKTLRRELEGGLELLGSRLAGTLSIQTGSPARRVR